MANKRVEPTETSFVASCERRSADGARLVPATALPAPPTGKSASPLG